MTVDWDQRTIGEICTVDWGNTKLTKKSYVEDGQFLAVSAAGCDGRIGHREHAKNTPVLSAIGAQCGRMFFPDEDFTAIKNTITLTPKDDLTDGRFLYYLLTFVELPQRGAGQPFISKGDIQKFEICVPALPEQRRIVAILDESFAAIATAVAHAEKNLKNARELFDSHLNAVFTIGSKYVRLAELADEITDGDHLPPPKAPAGVPFITISNIVKSDRSIDFSDTFFVPEDYYEGLKPSKKPRRGDVLYTVTGSFGIPVLVDTDAPFCFQRHIGLVRPNTKTDSAWLTYALLSLPVFAQATALSTGTAQKTVSLKVLRDFKIPDVALQDQRRIALQFDALSAETQRLETLYRRKLAALAELRQALLAQAFAGELTATSADAVA